MKIEIVGTPEECKEAAAAIALLFDISEKSEFHKNKGRTNTGRICLDAIPNKNNINDAAGWQRMYADLEKFSFEAAEFADFEKMLDTE